MVAIIVGKENETNLLDVKEVTKDHRANVKKFHNGGISDIKSVRDYLIEQGKIVGKSEVCILDVVDHLNGIISFVKASRKDACNQLEDLAKMLTQEDPSQELTTDGYELVKEIISDTVVELISELTAAIKTELVNKGYHNLANRKNFEEISETISRIVYKKQRTLMEDLDESISTVEVTSMEELKNENIRLKAKLAGIKSLIQ